MPGYLGVGGGAIPGGSAPTRARAGPLDRPDPGSTGTPRAELQLGSDPWPPFTDQESQPRIAIELVHAALDRTGVPAASRIYRDFAEVTRRIRAGELDGSAAIWRSEEREEYLLYSRAYFENRIVLIGRKGSDVSAADLTALGGKRIGIVSGYAYGPGVRDVVGPVLAEGNSVQENLKRLLGGDLDYVLADQLLAYHLLRQREGKGRELFQVGQVPIVRRTLHFAVRRDLPGAVRIVERFDKEIGTMMGDGSFNRILQVDWIEVDVDGDGKRELVSGGERAGREPPKESYLLFDDVSAMPAGTRFRIEGETYNGWNDVPGRYRTDMERQAPRTVGLFEFDF